MRSNLGTGISSIVLLALPIALQASFQENKGQSHRQIQFVAKFGEAIVRAYPGGLEFAFPESPSLRLAVNSATQPWIAESQRLESVDYQMGSDPSRWVRDVRTFDRLRMRDVVPGVDWIVYWQGANIEYDFEVSPSARLDRLTLQATGLPLRQNGNSLTANWKHGVWIQRAPRFFAPDGRELPGQIQPAGRGRFRFALLAKRPAGTLRVDPIVEISGRAGGPGEDTILAANASFAIGVTRSSAWDRSENGSGVDVFQRIYLAGGAYKTIFWGGEDDDYLSSATRLYDRNYSTERIYAVGYTKSRSLPIPPASTFAEPWAFGGGESDGLLINATSFGLSAQTFGGAGSEVLHGVQANAAGLLAFAGESRAPGSDDTQAFFGCYCGGAPLFWTGGGAGTDRIRQLALEDVSSNGQSIGTRIHFVGETDSDAINGQGLAWSRRAQGRDIWYGSFLALANASRAASQEVYPERSAIWGGGGDEDAGAIAFLPGRGIYIVGSTNSDNLPLQRAALPSYRGGLADGFVLRLDLLATSVLNATYWGGSGEDRILAAHAAFGDLLIAGATDSTDMEFPAEILGAPGASGRDGFTALLSAHGGTDWLTRVGGAGMDSLRFISRDAEGIWVGGDSTELSWLDSLPSVLQLESPYSTFSSLRGTAGGADAFLLRFRSTWIGLSDLRVGANLQSLVALQPLLEPSFDGLVTIESLDPSRLLLSLPGEQARSSVSFYGIFDSASPTNYGAPSFLLHAMGQTGEVEIAVKTMAQPPRRFTVEILPSAIFTPKKIAFQNINTIQSYVAETAALPFPTSLEPLPQNPRSGLDPLFAFIPSDPEALVVTARSYYDSHALLSQPVELRKSGAFTLTPRSPVFPTAPNERIEVRSQDLNPPSTFPTKLYVPRSLSFSLDIPFDAPLGSYTFSAEPSGALLFSAQPSLRGASALTFQPTHSQRAISVQADGDLGDVKLKVEGPNGWSRLVDIRIVPTRISFTAPAVRVSRGQNLSFTLSFSAQPVPGYGPSEGYSPAPVFSFGLLPLLPGLQVSVQPPSLASRTRLSQDGANRFETFFLSAAGLAEFRVIGVPDHFLLDTPLRIEYEILPPTLLSRESEIVLPQGARRLLNVIPILPQSSAANVGVSFSTAGVARVSQFSPSGDTTINYSISGVGREVYIDALGKPGDRSVLKLSTADGALLEIPIRIVPSHLQPAYDSYLIENQRDVEFRIAGSDAGRPVPGPFLLAQFEAELNVKSSQPELCSTPARVSIYNYRQTIAVTCHAPGEAELEITPVTVLTPGNPLRIRVKSGVNPLSLAGRKPFTGEDMPGRFIVGSYLQLGVYRRIQIAGSPIVSVHSEDPSLLRVAASTSAVGATSLQFPAGDYINFFMQSLGPTGSTSLVFTNAAGERRTIPVFIWPSSVVFPRGVSAEPEAEFTLNGASATNLRVPFIFSVISPLSGETYPPQGSLFTLAPTADPIVVKAKSSEPSVAEVIPPTPILTESGGERAFTLRLNAPGETNVDIEIPPAFNAARDARLRLKVLSPRLTLNQPLVLAEGIQRMASVSLGQSGNGSRVPVTVTSSDATILQLAHSPSGPASASILVESGAYFYVRCLRAQPAFLELSSPQLSGVKVEASYETIGLLWQDFSPIPLFNGRPGQRINVVAKLDFLTAIGKRASNGIMLLPDVPWKVYLRSSDESITLLENAAEFTPNQGTPLFNLSFTAGNIGEAELRLESTGGLAIEAQPARARISPWILGGYGGSVGRGAVEPIRFYLDSGAPTNFTISSSNPAFALAASPLGAPSQTLEISSKPNTYVEIFLFAPLAEAATEISFLGPNISPAPSVYSSRASNFSFASQFGLSPIVDLFRQSLEVPLQFADPYSSNSTYGLNPMVGPQTVNLSSSNPAVAEFASPTLLWQPGQARNSASLRLRSAGSTILRISPPAGFGGSGQEIRLVVR